MRVKVYDTTGSPRIPIALAQAAEYLKPFNVTFEPVIPLRINPIKNSLYRIDWIQTILNLQVIRSISPEFMQSLKRDNCEVVVVFFEKGVTVETPALYGKTDTVNRISYCQVFDSASFIHYPFNPATGLYVEQYTPAPGDVGGTAHSLIHELFHALSAYHNIFDDLHPFIQEGQFDAYKHYLQFNLNLLMNPTTNSQKLFQTAMDHIGRDVTPNDEVPDTVACAQTVSTLIHLVNPSFPVIAGTFTLFSALSTNGALFQVVDRPQKGDILIYATGTGNGTIPGHVFICDDFEGPDTKLYSNSSEDGIFKQNYTLKTAAARYATGGGFTGHFFRMK